MKRTRFDWPAFGLLCAGVIGVLWRFWTPGIASAADMLMGVYRVFELDEALSQGILYPRLGTQLGFGYSAPLFQFYPPLASYIAVAFHFAGLGFIQASKATFVLSLLLAAVGTYVYGCLLLDNRRSALVAAAAYLFSPYLLLVIYERGAAAELLALGLLPWLFWSLHRVVTEEGRNSFWLAGLLVGLLVLAHNITALFVLPAALFYAFVLALGSQRQHRLRFLFAGVFFGISLTAFYWLPAIGELRYTRADQYMLSEASDVRSNLIHWQKLFQFELLFDYWGEERFRIVWWQALLGILGMTALPLQAAKQRHALGALAALFLIALLLQLEVSRLFWEIVPLVRYIQFSWRLLGLASFCAAILMGSLFQLPILGHRIGWGLAIALIAAIAVMASANLQPSRSPIWYTIGEDEIGLPDLFARGRQGFSLFTDYSPKWIAGELSRPRPDSDPPFPRLTQPPLIEIARAHPYQVDLRIQAAAPFTLRFHRVFFPGWRVSVDGQPVETRAEGSLGLVTADLPAGDYAAALRFGQTPLRSLADLWSIAAVLGGLAVWLAPWKRHRMHDQMHYRVWVAAALLISIAATWLALRATPFAVFHRPTVVAVNFEDELQLLGFHLDKTSWEPGTPVDLRLYWFAQQTPDDHKVFLHLVTPDDAQRVAQFDSEPVLGYSPMSRWEAGEIVTDLYRLSLDAAVPPGRYLLLMGIYRPETMQNLRVDSAPNLLPGDRVILGEIEVRR
ncbi:MAG: hypothetical protein IT329_20665 [Caldilineaceae bacterium]|nr:hypothetical protein [Caldilineaceae bacterium]